MAFSMIGIYLLLEEEKMRDWQEMTDARNRAHSKYDKENTVGIYMKLNIHTDKEIIRWLWGQPSKQGAIKRLIRDEIAREKIRRTKMVQDPAYKTPVELFPPYPAA